MKSLFLPYIGQKIDEAENESDILFTHTTDIDAAKSIISNSEIWMTNVPKFTDEEEVRYGKRLVDNLMKERFGNWLSETVMDGVLSRLFGSFENYYKECLGSIEDGTGDFLYDQSFAFCLRENTSEDIDYMWKNYVKGKSEEKAGCMLAFSGNYLCGMFRDKGSIDDVMFLLAPMFYLDEKSADEILEGEIEGLKESIRKLRENRCLTYVQKEIILALQSTILLLKRGQFYREKEWRIVFSPMVYGDHESYNQGAYEKKDYPDDGSESERKRLIYDRDKNVYRLRLGVWEGEENCDWNRLLKCVYVKANDRKQENQAFDELKEILSAKCVINPESKIKFA